MERKTTLFLIMAAVVLTYLAGRFIYHNVVIPWPYRHELRRCLDAAKDQPNAQAAKDARNRCFRTYPHFL